MASIYGVKPVGTSGLLLITRNKLLLGVSFTILRIVQDILSPLIGMSFMCGIKILLKCVSTVEYLLKSQNDNLERDYNLIERIVFLGIRCQMSFWLVGDVILGSQIFSLTRSGRKLGLNT